MVPFVGVELVSISNNNNNNNCVGDHVIFEGVPSEAPSTVTLSTTPSVSLCKQFCQKIFVS